MKKGSKLIVKAYQIAGASQPVIQVFLRTPGEPACDIAITRYWSPGDVLWEDLLEACAWKPIGHFDFNPGGWDWTGAVPTRRLWPRQTGRKEDKP